MADLLRGVLVSHPMIAIDAPPAIGAGADSAA